MRNQPVFVEMRTNPVVSTSDRARNGYRGDQAKPAQAFRILRRTGTVLSTHPDIEDRVQALQLEPRMLADGNVRVGEIAITVRPPGGGSRRRPMRTYPGD